MAIWRKEIVLDYVDKFLEYLRSNFQATSNKIVWKGKIELIKAIPSLMLRISPRNFKLLLKNGTDMLS